MTENKPPNWESDSLSVFFRDAEYNDRVNALKLPEVFDVLCQVHDLFRKCDELITSDNRDELLVPRFLMVRSHSAFLAGIRIAMSGQAIESLPVLRSLIESAWYALHIAKDPKTTERAQIWLLRNNNGSAKKQCRSEFSIAKILKTHEELDATTAKEMEGLYETLIDFGAHRNQFGVMTAMAKTEGNAKVDFSVGILNPEPLPVVFALWLAVGIALGALKAFQLIFPERFEIAGLDTDIEALIPKSNALFKSYVQT